MAAWYRWDDDDLVLNVHVQPRASRDEIAGLHGDALKIRITAAPADGKANAHLIGFLAAACGVSRSAVSLLSGATGRRKLFRIHQPVRLPPGVERR